MSETTLEKNRLDRKQFAVFLRLAGIDMEDFVDWDRLTDDEVFGRLKYAIYQGENPFTSGEDDEI